jgi:hypothetical protein
MTPEQEFEFRARAEAEERDAEQKKNAEPKKSENQDINPLLGGAYAAKEYGSKAAETAGAITGGKMLYDYLENQKAAKAAVQSGAKTPDQVQNWLKTQTSNPFAGGRNAEEAYRKSEIAAGKPIQSRGSEIPIRKGNLGISNQIPTSEAETVLEATPQSKLKQMLLEGVSGKGYPGKIANTAIFPLASTFGAGVNATNAINQLNKDQNVQAGISGLGALSSLATMIPHEAVRKYGALGAVGAPLINAAIDMTRKVSPEEPMTPKFTTEDAFNAVSSLLGPLGMAITPSQLGDSTLTKSGEPDSTQNLLKNTTLPQQSQYADGGAVNLDLSKIKAKLKAIHHQVKKLKK